MTNELLPITNKKHISSLIYEIRGKQVMLDSDVAFLYGYEARAINQTVKRNIERFPEEFCFKLTVEEYKRLLNENSNNSSQVVISSTYKHRGTIYTPNVFTEQGIAMLSGLLRNEIAVKVSINIMKAFVEMRKFITQNKDIFNRLTTVEYTLLEHDKKIDKVFDLLEKDDIIKEKVFFNGEIYDAYSLVVDIIKNAKKRIIIIDNYIDKTTLDLLSKKNTNTSAIIITSQNCKLTKLDITKFNEQYPKLKVNYSNEYHDRFIIVDDVIYHCGASFKDLGKKCFAITKLEDVSLLEKLMKVL